MKDKNIKKLQENIELSNNNKSSHWKLLLPKEKKLKDYQNVEDQLSRYYRKKNEYLNKYEHLGAGAYTYKSYKDFFYKIFQNIIYGSKIFQTDTYNKYKILFDKNHRFIDNDTIRHIFTFEKLKELVNPKTICVIGDGKLNGLLGAYLTFKNSKIFTINLSEVLINDYVILKEFDKNIAKSIEIIDNENFEINKKTIYLLPSNLKNFLLNKKIDLFINIAAFQEMNIDEINSYFNIIQNNKSKLYCCNREFKKLTGGEEIYFENYPWKNSKIIFWENCKWHQKYFDMKFPFIHKYDGNVKHCLVSFD